MANSKKKKKKQETNPLAQFLKESDMGEGMANWLDNGS
jgi:hypothetical protein